MPKTLALPAFRCPIDNPVMFMTRITQVDEPFLEQQPRRLLQQLNPAFVVGNKVVIGE